METRHFEERDIETVLDLQERTALEGAFLDDQDSLANEIENHFAYVVEREGEIAGFVIAIPLVEGEMDISRLAAVDAETTRELLKAVETQARQEDIRRLFFVGYFGPEQTPISDGLLRAGFKQDQRHPGFFEKRLPIEKEAPEQVRDEALKLIREHLTTRGSQRVRFERAVVELSAIGEERFSVTLTTPRGREDYLVDRENMRNVSMVPSEQIIDFGASSMLLEEAFPDAPELDYRRMAAVRTVLKRGEGYW